MKYLKGTLRILLAQQSGQIQLLIIAPILTLSFLSLIVRTASSAVDPSLEKKKVTEQLKRRLSEVQNEEEIKVTLAVEPPTLPPPPQQTIHRIKKHATLVTILNAEGLDPEETAEWLEVARKLKELQRMNLGHTMTLSFTGNGEDRALHTLSYEIDKRSLLVLERKADGNISVRREPIPSTLVWRGVGGRIRSNLYNAAVKAGVPAHLVDDLADMDWDLDFSSDLQPGDIFKVLFEEFQRDGKTIEYGRILAAEIVSKGKVFTLFSIPDTTEDGSGSSGANRQFLRYPLQFTRISSVFTYARFHPILERPRPHMGVDFAAPVGTPVRAVASGKVIHAGRNGQFGNFVRIDHPGPYDSAYAHLQRIVKGLKVGSTVERGQVIGHVGSTGLATGPHLHFALYKDGKYINPLTAKLPVEEAGARPAQNRTLAETKKRLTEQLAALKVRSQPVSLVVAAVPNTNLSASKIAEPPARQRLAQDSFRRAYRAARSKRS
ncbi:MAG: peptidoglycan DD-metalloendopeptidase family protein [Deltaproteobacteria bacterium]|nr:peptidoglycan DD-metalloendopeptidase family protein [Deltaproteobacteria bacterium]